MKKSSKFLPVIGWSMWFAEYLFLERSWAKDERTLKTTPSSKASAPGSASHRSASQWEAMTG